MELIRRLGVVLLMLVCAGVAAPQEPSAEPTAAAVEQVPAEHANPRATMTTFLKAFYQEPPDLERAASCLDLSGLSATVRGVKGRELAVMLKEVLDRTRLIDLEEVPVRPQGDRWVVQRYANGLVELARQPDGRWLFSAATVRDLGAVFAEVADRAVVAGVERAAEMMTPAMWVRSLMPETLRRRVFLLEGWQWLGLLAVILVGVVTGRVVGYVATGSVDRLLARRFREVDRPLVAASIQPAAVFVMVVLWGVGALWLGLPANILSWYVDAVLIAAVVVFVVTAYRLTDVASAVLARRAAATEGGFDDLLVPLARKTVKVFIVAVGLVTILQNVGADVTGLVAGLGLGGLAFALAAKDTVSNLFGSITVLVDRPFQVGDWVKVGDVEGTVEEMGFRSTRIRTFYNSLITLPNSNLIAAAVDNLGVRTYRRWSTRLGIAYDTPPERVDAFCEGIRELVRHHPYTRKDYFHVYFNEFGAASLEVLVYVFFHTPDWSTELRERHRLAVDILRLAHELDVEFAFPRPAPRADDGREGRRDPWWRRPSVGRCRLP